MSSTWYRILRTCTFLLLYSSVSSRTLCVRYFLITLNVSDLSCRQDRDPGFDRCQAWLSRETLPPVSISHFCNDNRSHMHIWIACINRNKERIRPFLRKSWQFSGIEACQEEPCSRGLEIRPLHHCTCIRQRPGLERWLVMLSQLKSLFITHSVSWN